MSPPVRCDEMGIPPWERIVTSLCIERGLLLKRALNQLKANKVSLVRQLRVWDWMWD